MADVEQCYAPMALGSRFGGEIRFTLGPVEFGVLVGPQIDRFVPKFPGGSRLGLIGHDRQVPFRNPNGNENSERKRSYTEHYLHLGWGN